MKHSEIQKSKSFNIGKEVEYAAGSIVIKTIISRVTGSISAFAFDKGEVLIGRVSPYDRLIQVIEGSAEVIIDSKSNLLEAGESIIIPAHVNNSLNANVRFKVLSTIIKSGYEEMD